MSDTISLIENENDLTGYKLIECSSDIEGTWALTWDRDYGNGLINSYDCINAIIDSKDGSVMLFGKNKIEPNTTVANITKEEAIKLAKPITSKYDDKNTNVKLNFFKPNFYFEEGGPYEVADFVRLSWEVSVDNCVSVQIDAETGEILGGGAIKSISARSMFVVNFPGQQECAVLASNAFNRLGYSQANYPPVYWSIGQTDIDWMLSRPDMYALYLSCHGGVIDGRSVLSDVRYLPNANWQVWSDKSYGNWRFVYLDACYTSSNSNFANAFNATNSGECFVGWNNSINEYAALDFDRRFFPRLGSMSVGNDVVTSLWESRNAGYNSGDYLCNPGFMGDPNYYGWAW